MAVICTIILVAVNTLFALAGLAMLAIGITAAVDADVIMEMFSAVPEVTVKAKTAGFNLEETIQNCAVFLIILGAVVAAVGLFGCIGACCRVRWMLGIYISVLVIVLLAEVALIIFAVVYPSKVKDEAQPAMLKSLQQFRDDGNFDPINKTFTLPTNERDLSWAVLQFQASCCGAYGYKDYENVTFRSAMGRNTHIPISCCKLKVAETVPTKESDFVNWDECLNGKSQFINEQDCYTAMETLLTRYGRIAIGIAAAIIALEVILLILAIWLCRSIDIENKSMAM